MRKSYFILLFVIISIFSCSKKMEQTKPKVTTLTESVYASLTVQPEDMYNVFAATPGILAKVFIEDGDSVSEGQILAQITASKSQLNVENAMLNVDLARDKYTGNANVLKSIADDIKSVEKQLKLDSINYFRQKNLWDQKVGTQLQYDQAKLKYELSKSQLDQLRLKYKQSNIELENSYKQSQNALKRVQTDLSDNFIRSKLNGRVYNLLKNEGEIISQQEPLAQIGRRNSFEIELLIDEVDIAKVKMGQQVIITLDAYRGETFEAVVTKIYPIKDNKTQTFMVKAIFNKAPAKLYAGLSGEANIIISQKKNTLTIPLDYLNGDKVLTENGEIEVKTGLNNLDEIEITSGLDSSTVILKPKK